MENLPLRSLISTKSNYSSYHARRNGETQLSRAFRAYAFILVHFVLSFALAIMMKYFVDGIKVSSTNRERLSDGLRSSDVMTIISTTLVIVRLFSSALVVVSAWRCAFILLETEGLDLLQFDRMVSWHLPWPLWMGASKNFLLATSVLLLMLPSSLVAPLLSGSVDWNVILEPDSIEFVRTVNLATPDPPDVEWGSYVYGSVDRYWVTTIAAGFYSLAWANAESSDTDSCRHVMNINVTLPVNSTIHNATLPYLKIHSITLDEAPFPLAVNATIQDSAVNGRSEIPPFSISNPGNAIFFNSTAWSETPLSNTTLLPPPMTFHGEKKVAVLVSRKNTNGCMSLGQGLFGDADLMSRLGKNLAPLQGWGGVNCYLVATVNFTAGVIKSPENVYVSNRVIEATGISQLQIEPDRWVGEALYLMSDVMSMTSVMNTSALATWGNVTNYIDSIVRYSYQASWDALDSRFNSVTVDLKATKRVQMLQAIVSLPRVAGWLAAQLLVTLASFILFILQGRCHRQVIVDVAAAAITTDARPLLEKEIGLTDMSYVTGEDARLGKLRLAVNEETDTMDAHFTLGPG